MNQDTTLKFSAIMFAVLWTGGMIWSSGSFDAANIIILALCGAAAGYAWYRAMRYWMIGRMRKTG